MKFYYLKVNYKNIVWSWSKFDNFTHFHHNQDLLTGGASAGVVSSSGVVSSPAAVVSSTFGAVGGASEEKLNV